MTGHAGLTRTSCDDPFKLTIAGSHGSKTNDFAVLKYFFVHFKFSFVKFDAMKSIKVQEVQQVLNVPKDTKVLK